MSHTEKRLTLAENEHKDNRFWKLSRLQRWILERAADKFDNRFENSRKNIAKGESAEICTPEIEMRLKYSEIRRGFYGYVKVKNSGASKSRSYKSASAAISRAVSRLENRGLVTVLTATVSHWTAVTITELGRDCLGKCKNANHETPTT
jgi:hypothetical protein